MNVKQNSKRQNGELRSCEYSTTVDGEFVVENYQTRKYNMFKNTTLIDR